MKCCFIWPGQEPFMKQIWALSEDSGFLFSVFNYFLQYAGKAAGIFWNVLRSRCFLFFVSFTRGMFLSCGSFFIGKDDLAVISYSAGGDIFHAVLTYKMSFQHDPAVDLIFAAESAGRLVRKIMYLIFFLWVWCFYVTSFQWNFLPLTE